MPSIINGQTGITCDTVGNLGLGTTPAAWSGVGGKVFQIGNTSIFNSTNSWHACANTYYDGSVYRYIVTDYACDYYQGSGTHTFRVASSSTAGSPVTWITALVIASDGTVSATGGNPLGYGNGSGGVVTQLTSKTTAITINKPSGRITTHNASLAAGAVVAFSVNNLTSEAASVPVVSIYQDGVVDPASYNVWTQPWISGGGFNVFLRNISAGPLAQAVGINFAVIKGAIA